MLYSTAIFCVKSGCLFSSMIQLMRFLMVNGYRFHLQCTKFWIVWKPYNIVLTLVFLLLIFSALFFLYYASLILFGQCGCVVTVERNKHGRFECWWLVCISLHPISWPYCCFHFNLKIIKSLKEGGSQFFLEIVVNYVVVWSSPDSHLNCSILSVLAAVV